MEEVCGGARGGTSNKNKRIINLKKKKKQHANTHGTSHKLWGLKDVKSISWNIISLDDVSTSHTHNPISNRHTPTPLFYVVR